MDYFMISTRTTDYPSVGKKMKLGSYFIPHTKIYSIWIKHLMKIKHLKFLDYMWHFCYLW